MDKSIKVEKKHSSVLPSNIEKCDSLALAAHNLIKQLDLMRSHVSYQNVFILAAINHGVIYNGPTFNIQLENLREELSRFQLNP